MRYQIMIIRQPVSFSIHSNYIKQSQKDRAYFVKIGDTFKEVKMASVLVNGLQMFNENENRKKSEFDKSFVKALIIGLCTKKSIENGEEINKDLLIFIKGKQLE